MRQKSSCIEYIGLHNFFYRQYLWSKLPTGNCSVVSFFNRPTNAARCRGTFAVKDEQALLHVSVMRFTSTAQAFGFLYQIIRKSFAVRSLAQPCVTIPTEIKNQWRESWKSTPVVNAHLVDDPTIWLPGFTLPRQQWSLPNRFRTGQGRCGACRKTWHLQTLTCAPWWDPNDVPDHWILPFYQAEWRSVPAALCWCWCYCLVSNYGS